MTKRPSPSNKNLKGAYFKAYQMARQTLVQKSPECIASNTGAVHDNINAALELNYMSHSYRVYYQDGTIVGPDNIPITDTVLMTLLLHYLNGEDCVAPTGEHIAFSEIPGGGAMYDSAYQKRVIKPLVNTFGNQPEAMIATAKRFNAEESGFGDAAATINVLPFVPVTFIIWRGDDEFPPSATTLFDKSVSSYLAVEDIVIMASLATYTMIKSQSRDK